MHIRFERSQLLGQLEGDHDFAHADRMKPCRSLLCQTHPQFAIVNSQTLSKFFAITAAPDHFKKISGQKACKPEGAEQIVEEGDYSWVVVFWFRHGDRLM